MLGKALWPVTLCHLTSELTLLYVIYMIDKFDSKFKIEIKLWEYVISADSSTKA